MSSTLSSSPSDFEEICANEDESKSRLSKYKLQFLLNNIAEVLKSFIDNLPPDRKQVIIKFITTCDNNKTLFNFSKHYIQQSLLQVGLNFIISSALLFSYSVKVGMTSNLLIVVKAHREKTLSVTSLLFENTDITTEKVAATIVQLSSQTDQEMLKNICFK
mgnify:CR=1 FL=1